MGICFSNILVSFYYYLLVNQYHLFDLWIIVYAGLKEFDTIFAIG